MTARRWLIGLLLGSMAAILIAPQTRWIVAAQIEQLAPFGETHAIRLLPEPHEVRASAQRVADRAPHDYRQQLAAVCMGYPGEERPDHLRALVDRFPDNPSLRAAILRFRCMKQVQSTGRTEETQLASSTKAGPRPSPESLAAFEEDARIGEQLDADNAFFPFMRSVVQFADGRDDEALESIQRAAAKSDWREYNEDEPLGELAIMEQLYGRQSAVSKTAVLAAVLLPHYAPLRSASRMALVKAREIEAKGDYSRGIAIRHSLIAVGGLMRGRGRTAITNVVGIAITRLAGSLQNRKEPGESRKETSSELQQRHANEYIDYVRQHGQAEEASWVRRQLDADVATRAILNPFPSDIIKMIVVLGASWIGCLFLLSNSLWLAAASAGAHLAGRLKSVRTGRALPKSVAVLCLGILALSVLASVIQVQRIAQTIHFLALLSGESDGILGTSTPSLNPIVPALAVIPVVLVIMSGVFAALALKWRVPTSVALVRGFRGLGLPVAAVLFIGYLALLLSTANRESGVEYYNQRWVDHEGRYAAELKNTEWIDVVR